MKVLKKIAIDARTIKIRGGSQTYAQNLLSNFPEKDNFILYGVKKFSGFKTDLYRTNQENPFFRLLWEILLLPIKAKKQDIDIFHGLKGFVPLFGNYKKVVTVHDLSHFSSTSFSSFKDYVYWRYISPLYVKKADHVITISNASRKDLIKYLGLDKKKITVIHLGYDKEKYRVKKPDLSYERILSFINKNNLKLKRLKEKKIILNVSTICLRKNILNLIEAFERIAVSNPNVILILSGRPGEGYDQIYNKYKKSPHMKRIFFLGYVPDEIVVDLYNIATVFAYPSFYEGFGLPILEAQACGCPVITSNVTSMPEIAGESALLVNPQDVNEMANTILEILTNNKLRSDLIKKGFQNIKRFSWEKCAGETLEVYKKLLDEK